MSAHDTQHNKIQLFQDSKIRSIWDPETEEWYFSVIDVISALTGSTNPRRYWSDLKIKLQNEGSQLYEKIVQLKLEAPDGKMRLTDVATTKQLLRLIQSIPSPRAEPFKLWLAQVGNDRLEQVMDPELGIQQSLLDYRRLGYSDNWINLRLKSIEVRKDLTDEWQQRGVQEGQEYAVLTDIIYKTWSGKTAREYKEHKGLTKENLRDNMSVTELVLNMLAETSTTEISSVEKPVGFIPSQDIARRGGSVAATARKALEKETGQPVVTTGNAASLHVDKGLSLPSD